MNESLSHRVADSCATLVRKYDVIIQKQFMQLSGRLDRMPDAARDISPMERAVESTATEASAECGEQAGELDNDLSPEVVQHGDYVRLQALSATQWNDCVGTVVSCNDDGRFGVLLHGYRGNAAKKAIKPSNLCLYETKNTDKCPSCKVWVNLFAFPPCNCKPTCHSV